MRKIDLETLCEITAGKSARVTLAEIGCIGVGLSFGLINPLLGFAMGLSCSGLVEAST